MSQDWNRANLAAGKHAMLRCVEHLDQIDRLISGGGIITNTAAAAAMQAALAQKAAPANPEPNAGNPQ